MVENYLGEELFRQGVHNYLAAHLYGNATAEDFWTAQTNTSHQPVDKIMSSFVDQPGVPLLTLGEGGTATQSRFYLDPGKSQAAARASWNTPVCLKNGKKQTCEVISSEGGKLTPPAKAPFLYANAGDHGYYRTVYTPAQLKSIIAGAETLSAPERIGLLGDQYAFTRTGQGSVNDFLDLALALKSDPDAPVLESALYKAESVESVAAVTPEQIARFDAVVLREFGPVYRALGKPNRTEPYNTQARRTVLFTILGASGDKDIQAEARVLTEEVFAGKKPVDPALTDASTWWVEKKLWTWVRSSAEQKLPTAAPFSSPSSSCGSKEGPKSPSNLPLTLPGVPKRTPGQPF